MRALKRELARAGVIATAVRLRIFSRPRRFPGSARDICAAIIAELWNGRYYQTGLGHFNFFWIRDFAIVTESLIGIGERDKVVSTLEWALENYRQAGFVTLCLDSAGDAYDLPRPSIDALPWLLHALRIAGMTLSEDSLDFLTKEVVRYCEAYIEPSTGLLKTEIRFSELRDVVKYNQSAYAITMLAILVRDLAHHSIVAPHSLCQDYSLILKEKYWNGSYFNADSENNAFSAEANLFPFLLEVIIDESMLESVLQIIINKGLTSPLPMRYTDTPKAFRYYWWSELFMSNYAGDTIWTWHGVLYLHLLQRVRHRNESDERQKFSALIERAGNFPELLNSDGTWYQTPFYRADEGMVWAALYLSLPLENETFGHE